MTQLALVIVSWNVRELLRACLQSLLDDLERSGIDADIWIVDNASADGTADMVSTSYPSCHLIASPNNVGFAAGNNLAIRQILESSAPVPGFLWLLNPDTQVKHGTARALLDALRAEPIAGIAGAKLLNSDGSLQQGGFHFPGLTQLAFELFPLPARFFDTPLNGRYPRSLYDGVTPFFIDHPLGASMVVRTAAAQEVGLMDEGYQMYCEEIDWCWRMRRAGWRAVCVPAAEVIHHGGQSTSQVRIASFTNLWTSRARLYATYHSRIVRTLARAMVRMGMRRHMSGASPGMVAACEQVISVWRHTA